MAAGFPIFSRFGSQADKERVENRSGSRSEWICPACGLRPPSAARTRMRRHRFWFLLLAPVAALAPGGFIAEAQTTTGKGGTLEPLDPLAKLGKGLRYNAVVQAVNRVKGAVVNIHSERTVQGPSPSDPFALQPAPNQVNGMGTGIIIDPR